MCGTEVGWAQDKVTNFWCNVGRAEETEEHLFFFFKGAHLVSGKDIEEWFQPNTSNKSANQLCTYNFTAASLSVEQG